MRRLWVLLFVLACGPRTSADVAEPPLATPSIAWADWEPEPFERAKAQNKIVIVDIGMEGCTACRWMDEITYTNPKVVELITEHFVAVQVDAEARPDIGERYANWAWPATIFIAPNGEQVLAIRGNKLPKNFVPVLEQLIDTHARGKLTGDGKEPIAAPGPSEDAELGALRKRIVAIMDRRYDDKHGGWGRNLKFPAGPHVAHAFMRVHSRGETAWRDKALTTLEGYGQLLDPVWGGIFVGSFKGWSSFVPEKRAAGQAGALRGFAEAHRVTGDEVWIERARNVDKYMRGMMQAEDGAFFASQEDDAPNLPEDLDARRYYAELDDAGRRQYGVPPIDHATYTDLNALVIRAYVELYEATGDAEALATATRAADAMLQRQTDAGWFRQGGTEAAPGDDRMRHVPKGERAYLQPQGVMGLALLSLARATGERRWLEHGERLADGLLAALEDPKGGGFFATDDASMDAFVARRKPVEANAQVAQFLYLMAIYTKRDELARSAERALRAVAVPNLVKGEGMFVADLAIGLELLTRGAVEISVVGDATQPQAKALFEAGRASYEPRKVLHYIGPGRYPDQGRPALFVCNDEACSPPIVEPGKVAPAVAKFKSGN